MEPTYIVMFISRNKDNQHIVGFKPRKVKFFTHLSADDKPLLTRFRDFIHGGLPSELSRMYISVNARDMHKTQVALQHYLLGHDVDFVNFDNKIISLAAKPEHALTHHWLLDVDTDDELTIQQIEADLTDNYPAVQFKTYPTLNGYAIVCDHGFDTRKLLTKFPIIDLKQDDMLMKYHGSKHIERI